jgi:hypothetical protein
MINDQRNKSIYRRTTRQPSSPPMPALLSRKERTEKEYFEMLRVTGFRLDRTIDVGMSTSILESVAV